MKKRVKTAWLKALRSGKYEQATGWLHTDGGYCCLGVLCDLYCQSTGGRETIARFSDGEFIDESSSNSEVLTQAVMKWAGLSAQNPKVGSRTLSSWNDDTQIGFEGIADKIEQHL